MTDRTEYDEATIIAGWAAAARPPGKRVGYFDLTPDEREAVHQWVRDHNLEPGDIPLDGILDRDEATREWRIRKHLRRDGKLYIDGEDVASCIIRRRELRPLPWRTA